MRQNGKLDYLEMPGGDLPATKAFYANAFGWRFVDYGPDYAAFDEGLEGGFYAGARGGDRGGGESCGGEPDLRPAGRRDPDLSPDGRAGVRGDGAAAGNELAVWGDPTEAG